MIRCLSLVCLAVGLWSTSVSAQMISSSVPNQNFSSDFYKHYNFGGALRGPNWFADFGGGANGGVALGGGGVSGNLRMNFAQGSSQFMGSSAPSVTTMNGFPGSFQSGVSRPFVTGFVPVVGGLPIVENPLAEMAAVQQQQTMMSIQQGQWERQNEKLRKYLRLAELGQSQGNVRMARANYRNAIAIAAEPLRSQLQQRLQDLMSSAHR